MTWPSLSPRFRRRLLERVLPAALLLLAALAALDLLVGAGGRPEVGAPPVGAAGSSGASPPEDARLAREVLRRGLLGGAGTAEAAGEPGSEPILLGTITGSGGLALVRLGEREPVRVVRTGEELERLGRLEKVERMRAVFLGESGRRELRVGETGEGDAPSIRSLGQDRWVLAREDLERCLARLDHLAADLRVRPITRDGRPDGLEVAWLRSGSLGSRLGLEQGDLLRSVNGIPIGSMNDLVRIVGLLQVDREFTLSIRRDGGDRELSYEILD